MIKASGNPPPCTKQWTKLLNFYQYLSENIDNIYCFASKMQHHHSSYKKIWTILQWIAVMSQSQWQNAKMFLSMIFPILLSIWKVPKINYFDSTHGDSKRYSVEIIRIAFESQLNLRFIISLAEYIFDVSERLFSWINFCLIFLNIKKQRKLKTSIFWQFFFSDITWYSHKMMILYSMLFLKNIIRRKDQLNRLHFRWQAWKWENLKTNKNNLFLKYIKITRKLSLYQMKEKPKIRSFVISMRFFLLCLKNSRIGTEKKTICKNDQIYACVGFCVSWAVYFVACIVYRDFVG